MPRKADNSLTPKGGEYVRHLSMDSDERKKHSEDWKADRDHRQKLKEERFAAIQERRKNRPGGSGGSGGINVTVESDKK